MTEVRTISGRPSPTIKTLAAHTGYAIGTISRALRGSPVVTEQTREAILGVAKELKTTSAAIRMGRRRIHADPERRQPRRSTAANAGSRPMATVPSRVPARLPAASTAPFVYDGAMNGNVFLAYVEQVLLPTLSEGDVVVMDMCGRPRQRKKNLL